MWLHYGVAAARTAQIPAAPPRALATLSACGAPRQPPHPQHGRRLCARRSRTSSQRSRDASSIKAAEAIAGTVDNRKGGGIYTRSTARRPPLA